MAEFISELVAFIVIGYVIYRYVLPRVRTMMRDQQESIGKQVDNAKQAHERLQAAAELTEQRERVLAELEPRVRELAGGLASRVVGEEIAAPKGGR